MPGGIGKIGKSDFSDIPALFSVKTQENHTNHTILRISGTPGPIAAMSLKNASYATRAIVSATWIAWTGQPMITGI